MLNKFLANEGYRRKNHHLGSIILLRRFKNSLLVIVLMCLYEIFRCLAGLPTVHQELMVQTTKTPSSEKIILIAHEGKRVGLQNITKKTVSGAAFNLYGMNMKPTDLTVQSCEKKKKLK